MTYSVLKVPLNSNQPTNQILCMIKNVLELLDSEVLIMRLHLNVDVKKALIIKLTVK